MVKFHMPGKAREGDKRKAVFVKKKIYHTIFASFSFSGWDFHVFLLINNQT